MPSQKEIDYFRQGLTVLSQAKVHDNVKDAILKMLEVVPYNDLPLAKDSIARVLRYRQALEVKNACDNSQELYAIDQRYRDLYVLLKSVSSPVVEKSVNSGNLGQFPLAKLSSMNSLEASLMLLDWLRSKKTFILIGTALASTAGSAYWLYKYFNNKKLPEDKESSFDKTIKSIQRYRVFTQLSKDPDFSGDYKELLNADPGQLQKKKIVKKKDPMYDKALEWESEEKALMKEMDNAFNSLNVAPKLNYELPKLPEPTTIDPKDILGESKDISISDIFKQKHSWIKDSEKKSEKQEKPERRAESPKKIEFPKAEPPARVKRIPIKGADTRTRDSKPSYALQVKKKSPLPKNPVPSGHLVPIVKRTKRIKKVNSL